VKKIRESSGYNGKNHISKQDDFEFEYKEFTVSEFLEIRKRPPSSLKSRGESDDPEEQEVHSPEDPHINREKRIIFSIIILFFVLSCLFGAFYLTEYFLH